MASNFHFRWLWYHTLRLFGLCIDNIRHLRLFDQWNVSLSNSHKLTWFVSMNPRDSNRIYGFPSVHLWSSHPGSWQPVTLAAMPNSNACWRTLTIFLDCYRLTSTCLAFFLISSRVIHKHFASRSSDKTMTFWKIVVQSKCVIWPVERVIVDFDHSWRWPVMSKVFEMESRKAFLLLGTCYERSRSMTESHTHVSQKFAVVCLPCTLRACVIRTLAAQLGTT